jgi:hypothetical protein
MYLYVEEKANGQNEYLNSEKKVVAFRLRTALQ